MPKYPDAQRGWFEPDAWAPYKLWSGDEYMCPGCGTTIITGFGRSAIAVRHEEGFAKAVANTNPYIQVNDC